VQTSNVYQKHLNLSKRIQIEQYLNEAKSFREISELISKHPTSISREIKRNRQLIKCNRYGISKNYDMNCPNTNKPPHVCNACPYNKGCRKNKYKYFAEDAHNNYLFNLKDSRSGIDLNAEEFKKLNELVTDGIAKGHSFSMIINNYKNDISVCRRTLYNYQEKGFKY
jgi:IS30 family transposase